jgi:hypothetical protein
MHDPNMIISTVCSRCSLTPEQPGNQFNLRFDDEIVEATCVHHPEVYWRVQRMVPEEKLLVAIGKAQLAVARAEAAWSKTLGHNELRIPAEAELREKKRIVGDAIHDYLTASST